MLTPRKLLYINTGIDLIRRGIFLEEELGRYKVRIKTAGFYKLQFVDAEKAQDFMDRIICPNEENKVNIIENIIQLNIFNDISGATLLCRDNKELAIKLVKHLRKQYVEQYDDLLAKQKEEAKKYEQAKIDEIDSIIF